MIGVAVGFPLGKKLYKITSERQKAKATVSSNLVDLWSQEYWNSNYAGIMGTDATETDAEETSDDEYIDDEDLNEDVVSSDSDAE